MSVVQRFSISFGCDPELFLEKDGKIIGSERVLPEAGLTSSNCAKPDIVLDGVQVELNPPPDACRANLGNYLQNAFIALDRHLKAAGAKATFSGVVQVDRAELDALSEKSRILGCAPSDNLYGTTAININPKTFNTRSAGGHIHIGLNRVSPWWALKKVDPRRLVALLDVLVGNTCVLIDRDPLAAERRKVYGRAGEYRLPPHGVEYRTLSNFWLRSYQLFSLVTGLTRLAVCIIGVTESASSFYIPSATNKWDAEKDLLKRLDLSAVRRAINTNDLSLAKTNFEAVKAFMREHTLPEDCGLCSKYLDNFDYFTSMIEQHGIEFWFPDDPLRHWCNKAEGHGTGWEAFIVAGVNKRRDLEAAKLKVQELTQAAATMKAA